MGLDSIELIMEIEDAFKISIPDEEACQTVTVGKLYQCVLDKINVSTDDQCSSQKAFYLLRRALKDNLDIEAKVITPKTNTKSLIGHSDRRKLWSKVSENAPYKFPELTYPAIASNLIVIITIASGGYFAYLPTQYFKQNDDAFMAFVSIFIPLVILVYFSMRKILLPLKLAIPHGCDTLGGMSKHILYHNIDHFDSLTKNEIWNKLICIISEQLDVDQKDIKPESNFVEDFNL